MTPYANFTYFGVVLFPVLPTLVLGLVGRLSRFWILAATVIMLVVQYGGSLSLWSGTPVPDTWIVVGWAAFEWGVAMSFLLARARGSHRLTFYATLAVALLPLALAKYLPVFSTAFPLGFLGISYVTFRSLEVIIGIQDGLIDSLRPEQYFAFLFFFPTVSSGPIDRYRRFERDWKRQRTRAKFLEHLDAAIHRIFTGFLYKFIVAALVKQYWMDPAASADGALNTLSYMYAYSLYLFFDFAGYSAFAIGLSYLFGVQTPENFDRPFLARNIRDFWNRWHISLSWWLRDHVYMRFVMAATKGHWFKDKYLASYLGLFLSMGLMGLWHGAALHYILYGLYHGALLVGHEVFGRWNRRRVLWGEGPFWRAAGVVLTFQLVCFGFLLFSGRLTTPRASASGTAYEGSLERAQCGGLSGWAWNGKQPDTSIGVEIFDGDILVATVPADHLRQDLVAAGKGNGYHGFAHVVPSSLKDGRPHTVWAKFAGTDLKLKGSPQTITCGGG